MESILLGSSFWIAIVVGAIIISIASLVSSKINKPFDRFRSAQNRQFNGLTRATEGTWQGPFFFMQLADTQLGMLTDNGATDEEERLCWMSVQHINRLKPKFAIVCGDLIHAFPDKDQKIVKSQVKTFKNIFQHVDPDIPLVCLCGNHDIGNRPSAEDIRKYTNRFGDDYLTFWAGGVKCIVVNASLYKDGTACPELARVSAHDKQP